MPDALIIEDEIDNIEVLRVLLESDGYAVSSALTGAAGLDIAASRKFDVVLVDFALPGGIDGIETTRRLRAAPGYARTPIIGVTAYAQPHVHEEARRAGCVLIVTKPLVEVEKFLGIVNRLTRGDGENRMTTTTKTATANELSSMTSDQLDALPFGAIKLDAAGKILSYNAGESQLSGRPADEVVGKNFFTEVAPCTDVQAFHGAFTELVAHRAINRHFDFVFPFKTPVGVRITMLYEQREGAVWVLVDRLDGALKAVG